MASDTAFQFRRDKPRRHGGHGEEVGEEVSPRRFASRNPEENKSDGHLGFRSEALRINDCPQRNHWHAISISSARAFSGPP